MTQNIDALRRSALIYFKEGKYNQTLKAFDKLLSQGIVGDDLLNLAGMAHFKLGHREKAMELVKQAIKRNPGNAMLHNNLGNIYWLSGYWDEAAESTRKALQLQPDNSAIAYNLGQIYAELDRRDDAVEALKLAVEKAPGNHKAVHRLGVVHAQFGEKDDAVSCFEKVLEMEPRFVPAYFELVKAKKATPKDKDLQKNILALTRAVGLPDDRKATLYFALAEMCRNGGDEDAAFRWYERANMTVDVTFDRSDFSARVDELMSAYDADWFKSLPETTGSRRQPDGPRMIFVVGMPRSGTSLTEQILSAHSEVFGAGELTAIRDIEKRLRKRSDETVSVSTMLENLDEQALAQARQFVFNRLPGTALQFQNVIDKLPMNMLQLGLIATLFPDAAVIHCRRHPLDVILSCYFQNFLRGNAYAFNLQHLAHVYVESERLMQHWHEVLPIDIHSQSYEALTQNPESEARSLLAYAGLDWEDTVLSPESNTRAVKTASGWQIREGIHTDAVARWKRYREHLDPAVRILEAGGIPVE